MVNKDFHNININTFALSTTTVYCRSHIGLTCLNDILAERRCANCPRQQVDLSLGCLETSTRLTLLHASGSIKSVWTVERRQLETYGTV